MLAKLREDPAQCAVRDKWGSLPLHVAVACGAPERVTLELIRLGPTACREESAGASALLLAVKNRQSLDVIEALCDANPAAIGSRDEDDNDVMFWAKERGYPAEVISRMVSQHARSAMEPTDGFG